MQVEIWSDVVCPWCYLGMARLRRALAERPPDEQVELRWRSFELDPTADPEDDRPALERSIERSGRSASEVEAGWAHLAELGREEGLEYRFAETRRVNTLDAHRLLHLAGDLGCQDALKERMFRAYFTEGLALSDPASLIACCSDVGIEQAAAGAVLESNAFADAVRVEEEMARELGVSGVPFFVFNRAYAVAGAQPVEVFATALERAANST